MNMFAIFDENPAMTFQVIKKKRYSQTDAQTHNVKQYTPPQTMFAGGIMRPFNSCLLVASAGILCKQFDSEEAV